MIFNIISLVSLAVILLLSKILIKAKKGESILKILSIILLGYKTFHYIWQNIQGNFSIPVEISSIAYFIIPIIITLGLKKFYHIASFFGIIAGLGYFLYYIFLGFTLSNSFPVSELLLGIFSHGYLLISGITLFVKYDFSKTSLESIWIVILAMVSWSMVFFDFEMRGITFIYYIIKPKFLFLFNSMSLNSLLIMAYYIFIALVFYALIKLFYKINKKTLDSSCNKLY